MGCGTGTFILAVAPHCRTVVAIDVSEAMVDHLRVRVDAAGLNNVEVVRAGFLDYEHVGRPADFVFSRNALHQLPDFWKAMALRLEFSTFGWLLEPMLEHAGFRIVGVDVDPRRTYARYECVLDAR